MAIIRAKRDNYTSMSNTGLRDERMTLKAKGLLAYMLSLPDDWVFYQSELAKHTVDGKHSIRTALKELEDLGYLVREQKRDEDGKFVGSEWMVLDEPVNVGTTKIPPKSDNRISDNRISGNQSLLSTNSTNDLYNQKDSVETSHDDIGLIVEYLNKRAEKSFRSTSAKTKKLVNARLNDGFTVDDFKRVIDKKTNDWYSDAKMSVYLRPETLFGTKFESYLNETKKRKPKKNQETFSVDALLIDEQ